MYDRKEVVKEKRHGERKETDGWEEKAGNEREEERDGKTKAGGGWRSRGGED